MARPQQQGQKPAKTQDTVAVAEPVESPFRHFVPGEKPANDAAYFELLLSKLLRLNREFPEFDETWPRGAQALAGMNLLRLSTYKPGEVREFIGTVGGEFETRMSVHAESIVKWAESMWRIRQIYGTFRRYIRSFDSDGFEALLEDLKVRLPGLTPEFLTGFLRDAGEKVPAAEKPGGARQQQQRQSQQQESRGGDSQRRQQQPQQQQQQQTQKPEGGRGDRRRRQRGRGGNRNPQQQIAGIPRAPQPANSGTTSAGSDSNAPSDTPPKDPQQQQRRRNRRRFFRRKRGAEDKPGGGAPPASGE